MKTSSPASRIQANLQELFQGKLTPGDAYIRFQLTSDITALLSMEQIQESLVVETEKITPLPNMPRSVIGIMSSRDRVFCVFDLAQLLALPSSLISPRQYQVIVVEVAEILYSQQSIYCGLAVAHLQGITRVTPEQLQSPPPDLAPSLASFILGCLGGEKPQELLLDLKAIAKPLSLDRDR